MNFQTINPDKSISLFVKNIWLFEKSGHTLKTSLPFFADGYPGLMFQKTEKGLWVIPHQKLMPALFLYGQTIKPIELEIEGSYQLIVFQLYPFVLKSFFGVKPKSINDDCYDLVQLKDADIISLTNNLLSSITIDEKIKSLSTFLYELFQAKRQNLDFKIRQVIEHIITTNGQENISNIARALNLNARTLERRFLNETGLTPKQFAIITRFQSSFEQLTVKEFTNLTDIVYENGYADQSHFIKVFKAFTGQTPGTFAKK